MRSGSRAFANHVIPLAFVLAALGSGCDSSGSADACDVCLPATGNRDGGCLPADACQRGCGEDCASDDASSRSDVDRLCMGDACTTPDCNGQNCIPGCDDGFHVEGGTCVGNTRRTTCSALPLHASPNSVTQIAQTWDGEGWQPSVASEYNESPSTSLCHFVCDKGYVWSGDVCAAQPRSCSEIHSAAACMARSDCTFSPRWTGHPPVCGGVCGDRQQPLAPRPVEALPTAVMRDPQYILLTKSPTSINTCCRWDERFPESISRASIVEIRRALPSSGTNDRQLGISFSFDILGAGDPFVPRKRDMACLQATTQASIEQLLAVSEAENIPVLLRFETHRFWSERSDLWNWWDPTLPGYDPANTQNVEWTCWEPRCATKVSWFNWGRSIGNAPAPNLASSAFRAAVAEQLRALVPLIVDWYRRLPEPKKYLLAGVAPTAEIAIGVNDFFCPDGNAHVGTDPAPGCTTFKDGVQTGFAAAHTRGVASGTVLTPELLNAVVRDYVGFVTAILYEEGLPRSKLFNHAFGLSDGHVRPDLSATTVDVALTALAEPALSLYGAVAADPRSALPAFDRVLQATNRSGWGVMEWFLGDTRQAAWASALRNTLATGNLKVLTVNSWEGINGQAGPVAAIHQVLQESPDDWIHPAAVTKLAFEGNDLVIEWRRDARAAAVFLNVSTESTLTPGGTLASIDVANDRVTEINRFVKGPLAAGTYYVQLVSDTSTRRAPSRVYTVTKSP